LTMPECPRQNCWHPVTMDAPPNRDRERRKCACPNCPDHRPLPTGIGYGKGIKTISYECPNCGNKWEVQTPFDSNEEMP
jgi:hypothetical protein